jgi:hypothetical protein
VQEDILFWLPSFAVEQIMSGLVPLYTNGT